MSEHATSPTSRPFSRWRDEPFFSLGTTLLCSFLGLVGGFLATIPFVLVYLLIVVFMMGNMNPSFTPELWVLRFCIPIGFLVGLSIGAFCE